MPRSTIVHASVGPPKQAAQKSSDETTPSLSRANTLIRSSADSTDSLQVLPDISQKLADPEYKRACTRKALQKCSDIFVAYGPNDRSVFISPYTGFEMSSVKHRTLFDTFYKDAQLKIRGYYITAEGNELGIHEDVSGRAGWAWMDSSKTSATNYSCLKRWLSERQSQSPEIFATTTVTFGGSGTYFARCGIYSQWRNLPAALSQAIAVRTKATDLESKDQVSGYKRSWKVSPRIFALGVEQTYFVLWSDDSYDYGLEASCTLLQTLKSVSHHMGSLKSLTLSPNNPNQYFLIRDHGIASMSLADTTFLRHKAQLRTHYRECLAEFTTEFADIVHREKGHGTMAFRVTDSEHKSIGVTGTQDEFVPSDQCSKSKGIFSRFKRSKDRSLDIVRQTQ